MINRAVLGTTLALLLMTGAASPARAQQPQSVGQAIAPTGWVFNIAPYVWLPTSRLSLQYNLPPDLGGRLPTEVSTGPGDYLRDLDFALAVSAEARNGQFSLLTDFMYTKFSVTSGNVTIKSIDFFGHPSLPILRSLETSTGTTLATSIWTLAGGYTVLQGPWGNLDLLAGLRLLAVNTTTNFSLNFTVTGPRGNGATFGGVGGISGAQNIWDGIGGIRGRIRLSDTALFIPYYFDIGAGGSQLTWQIASGLGYHMKWGDLSATYRYLSWQQGGNAVVRRMSLGGPMLMVNFTF